MQQKHLTNQHQFMLKILVNRRKFSNLIRISTQKPTANSLLHGQKIEIFLLRSGIRQGYPSSPLLFNVTLKVPAKKLREGKEIKGLLIGKEEVKVMVVCIENLKESHTHRTSHTWDK